MAIKPRTPVKTPARAARPAPAAPQGFGLLDLLLVVAALFAAVTRTPLGGLGMRAWALATGAEIDAPPLLATFSRGPDTSLIAAVAAIAPHPENPAPADGFPEPYRSAVRLTLGDTLPPAAQALAAELPPEMSAQDKALAVLDRLYEGDPEAALERFVVGDEQRTRAISRARPHNPHDAQRFEVHRRFLPAADARRAEKLVGEVMGVGRVLSLAWPIQIPHKMTSPFGYRLHPVLKVRKLHNGVDLSVPIGTPVVAAQEGEVAVAKEDGLNGRYVVIDHGFGVRSSYCHMEQVDVKAGDAVQRGQGIGLSGNTGRSTGPHLHFTLKIGGQAVDPVPYRPADPPVTGS